MSKFTSEQIVKLILDSNALTDVSEIDSTKPLSDQGIDSLDISSIFLCIEEETNIKVPDEDIDSLTTVDEIVAYMNNKNG